MISNLCRWLITRSFAFGHFTGFVTGLIPPAFFHKWHMEIRWKFNWLSHCSVVTHPFQLEPSSASFISLQWRVSSKVYQCGGKCDICGQTSLLVGVTKLWQFISVEESLISDSSAVVRPSWLHNQMISLILIFGCLCRSSIFWWYQMTKNIAMWRKVWYLTAELWLDPTPPFLPLNHTSQSQLSLHDTLSKVHQTLIVWHCLIENSVKLACPAKHCTGSCQK